MVFNINFYTGLKTGGHFSRSMHGLAITHRGIEKTTLKELEEVLGKKGTFQETTVAFDASDTEIAAFAYKAQSIKRVGCLLAAFTVSLAWEKTQTILETELSHINFSPWLKHKTFKVESERIGNHDYKSNQITHHVGECILKQASAKVSMAPDIVVFVYTYYDRCYVLIDFCGFDCSKRDYKIFSHPASLNGAIAYHLIRESHLKDGGTFLDPFCGGGTIAIEAALYYSHSSPNYFRKDMFLFLKFLKLDLTTLDNQHDSKTKIHAFDRELHYFSATRKNAKIANVEKKIHISKIDVESLDIKLKEGEIDAIITYPPQRMKQTSETTLEKTYKELFHQAEYILSKDGVIVAVLDDTELFMKTISPQFSLIDTHSLLQGEKKLDVVKLKRIL